MRGKVWSRGKNMLEKSSGPLELSSIFVYVNRELRMADI